MDIAELTAFLAVADSGSFSSAAEQLYLTQPAVSKRVAALEQDLGNRLFDRIGRTITLTEAGRALLPRARRILEEIRDSQRAISNLAGDVAGRLNFATSHHIGLRRLPPVLRTFTERYPDVELAPRFMDSEAACRAVEHGDFELAVVTLPTTPSAPLQTIPVWADPLYVAVAREHPLAQQDTVHPDQLAEHRAILPAAGTYTREILEQTLAPLGIRVQVALSTNYLETIKMMVSIGLGWSVLPGTMADDDVRILKIDGVSLARTLGVVRHTERTPSNAAQAMMDLLAQENTAAQ